MFQLVNDEWFRKPFSKLEQTLRFPCLIKFSLILFLTRLLPLWALVSVVVWLVAGKIGLGIIAGFTLLLTRELFTLKSWYAKTVLPKHQTNIHEAKEIFDHSAADIPKVLIKDIKTVLDKASWGTVNIAYVGVAAGGWEIIFRLLYPLIVKTKTVPYYDLLVGFKNKSNEADQKLWEVAHEKNAARKRILLGAYLDEYGSRG